MNSDILTGKANFFNAWARTYDCLWTTVFYQAIHKRLLDHITLPPHPVILDLGCGTGQLLQRLGAKFPDLQGIGLDLSPEMLRIARQHNPHRPRLIFVQGNATALPFADNQFDTVFNTISFLHYLQPEQVFREVSRVLKPGGYFYLADSVPSPFVTIPFSPGGIRFYSPSERENLARLAGLSCLGHHYLLYPIILSIFRKKEI